MRPNEIKLHRRSARLELCYEKDSVCFDAEYLRVFSPSAEVQGHHPSQAVLQIGKKHVKIDSVSAVGNYAIQIHFSDGHNSGIYSWDLLWSLHEQRETNWQDYLQKLKGANAHRDPEQQSIQIIDPKSIESP